MQTFAVRGFPGCNIVMPTCSSAHLPVFCCISGCGGVGDIGTSFRSRVPSMEVLGDRVPGRCLFAPR